MEIKEQEYRLSPTNIKALQLLYFQRYKIQLSDTEANQFGLKLLQLVKSVYKPIPKLKPNQYGKQQ